MRVASVAASTIPITIFIALGIFYSTGIELNTVTLAALIVTLGMIVDNSIVIIDCYIEKVDEGMSRWHAVVDKAIQQMRNNPHLLVVRSNFEGTGNRLDVVMDNDEANRLGISKTLLSLNLATRFSSGVPLTTVWEGDYPVNVMLKDSHVDRVGYISFCI